MLLSSLKRSRGVYLSLTSRFIAAWKLGAARLILAIALRFMASSPKTDIPTVASRRSLPHETPVTVTSAGETSSPRSIWNIASAMTRRSSEFTRSMRFTDITGSWAAPRGSSIL